MITNIGSEIDPYTPYDGNKLAYADEDMGDQPISNLDYTQAPTKPSGSGG